MSDPLPLAAASVRLRGKPGRPRRGDNPVTAVVQTPDSTGANQRALAYSAGARLLTVAQAAVYLGIGDDTVRELVARGVLARVRIPAPSTAKRGGNEVRKVLLDRLDLDEQILAWREREDQR